MKTMKKWKSELGAVTEKRRALPSCGDRNPVTEPSCATHETNGDSSFATETTAGRNGSGEMPVVTETVRATSVSAISSELQALQRQRAVVLKSRIMQANRLQALVAGTIGYHSGMEKKDRTKIFKQAAALIKAVAKGTADSPMKSIIQVTLIGIDAFTDMKKALEKQMIPLAAKLPVAAWVKQPEQRGFGLLFLAIVIGETGDLNNYAGPAKLWRRLGCAPWTFDGQTLMGATWRGGKHGKLPAEQWEEFGYSPRRRSIAYLIGEGIVKQNFLVGERTIETVNDDAFDESVGDALRETEKVHADIDGVAGENCCVTELNNAGPYRLRYDETKLKIKVAHHDYSDLRAHRHGMLLAAKLLLKNLWIAWRTNRNVKPKV